MKNVRLNPIELLEDQELKQKNKFCNLSKTASENKMHPYIFHDTKSINPEK